MFPGLNGNNHVIKTDQVIAVGNEGCSVGEWSCTVQDQSGSTIQVHGYYTDVNFREGDTDSRLGICQLLGIVCKTR